MPYPGNYPRRYTVSGVELYPATLRRHPHALTWRIITLDAGVTCEILVIRKNYVAGGQLMTQGVTPSANDGCFVENSYLATALVLQRS
ncbi:hypothetical protein WJX72_002845 [[Myrmecia] bisecta]|uniref:Uncharacterized protein n=1 Tax=[Myrmecia] bisecta TaxID=41462 RepID=A0AAW1QPV3_9CHLO